MGLYEQVDYDLAVHFSTRPFWHRICDYGWGYWPPFDHYCAITYQNAGKACCDNQQWAFSCFGGKCAEPTKFTFHRQSIPPCRSSPTTATGQVFSLILRDASWFMLAKTRWSTVVRPRIDHYWKLTTLQDWNTSERRFSYISDRSSAG